MNRLQPSVGREQLRRLPELVIARRKAAEFYRGVLGDVEGLGLPCEPPWDRGKLEVTDALREAVLRR